MQRVEQVIYIKLVKMDPIIITIIVLFVILWIIAIYISLSDKTDIKKIHKINYKESDFYKELQNCKISNQKVLDLKNKLSKYIVWSENLINAMIVSILANWHILVEWVPWLAKTKTILVLSKLLWLNFKRIQFTPDMLPADIIWWEIYDKKTWDFKIFKWPIFTNLLLADEINRTTPKVQSWLLEAMEERKVTIWNDTFKLEEPFFVMATQNPIEQEWTFPLPEAQLDRFIFKVSVSYPNFNEEKEILNKFDVDLDGIEAVISREELLSFQKEIADIEIWETESEYIVNLVHSTRVVDENIITGASTRWAIYLKKASMVLAYIEWREAVKIDDIKRIALLVLRHRVNLSYTAMSKWVTTEEILINKFKSIKDYKW